jgi:predicted permease
MASWWKRLMGQKRLDRELDAELADHLARRVRDHVAAGLSDAEADRRARLELGGVAQVSEQCRDARGTRLLEELIADVRYGGRVLRRSPSFTLTALTVLALGIGANTAIFSLLESALLRRVPVTSPGELYFVAHRTADRTRTASNYPFLERVRNLRDAFAGVTAYTITSLKIADGDYVEQVPGDYAAGNYHGLLGVRFSLGRGFTDEDDRSPATASLAVISDRYWARRFGRSPDVLGRTLMVDGRAMSIVGVTAPGFEGFTPGRPVDVTLPLSLKALDQPDYFTMHDTWTSLSMIVRLRPDVPAAQAAAGVETLLRQYLSEPENAWYKAEGATLLPADRGSDELRRRYSTSLVVLMAMVGVVLLMACANIASLLLARAAARTREVAVRLSMGAGRSRLVRQFLTESLLLAGAGGLAGFFLAMWGTSAVAAILDVGANPVVLSVRPNLAVVGFAAALSIVTGIAFGLTPALRATRVELTPALKEGEGLGVGRAQGPTPWRRLWSGRQLLVVGQIASCVLLVSGAGLLVRTLANLQASDGSFSRENVLLVSLVGRDTPMPLEQTPAFCASVLERLRLRPEIGSASCSTSSPVDSADCRRGAIVGATPVQGGAFASVITPDYFRTFAIPLVRGRVFGRDDSPRSTRVGIINERMARVAFGSGDPIGRTFHFRADPDKPFTIVGVVRDVPQHSLREPAPPTVYTPLGQEGGEVEDFPLLAIRSTNEPSGIVSVVRSAVGETSRDVVVLDVKTLVQQLDAVLVRERVLATLASWFGVLAVALACVGLYGLMSYEVTRRRREIGIRLALGAHPAEIGRLVLRQTSWLAIAGVAVGLIATLATTRVLSTLLYGLSSRDPSTLAATTALLAATTLAAGYVPARRAARVDPTQALRSE